MRSEVLFSGVATADLSTATAWYEKLVGRPADIIVNENEVMWRITDGGWLYVVVDKERAGRGLTAIAVGDLDQALTEVTERGLAAPSVETAGSAGRKASFVDPDGNTTSLLEVGTAPATSDAPPGSR